MPKTHSLPLIVLLVCSTLTAQSLPPLTDAAKAIQQSQTADVVLPEQSRKRKLNLPAGTPLDIEALTPLVLEICGQVISSAFACSYRYGSMA